MRAIISLEAVQANYLSNLWLANHYVLPDLNRLQVFARTVVLPDLDPLKAPPNPEAERLYFCCQLLFLQTLLSQDQDVIQLVSGYWGNYRRLFFEPIPAEIAIEPPDVTVVLDFSDITDNSAVNNRLYWERQAQFDPTIHFLAVTSKNWRQLLSANISQHPGSAGL